MQLQKCDTTLCFETQCIINTRVVFKIWQSSVSTWTTA